MNKRWNIIYCSPFDGNCPISEFIESCHPKHQAKIMRFFSLLEERGPNLPRPYADILRDGIHELRLTLSGEHVRFLYFFCFEKFIMIYSAFPKHTDRIPDSKINKIVKYKERFLEEMSIIKLQRVLGEEFQPAS